MSEKIATIKYRKPKFLYIDIETSLLQAWAFNIWNVNIPISDIINDWRILCISYAINDREPVELKGTEKSILKKISKTINSSDIAVHHNGVKFDMKRINTRLLFHGLPPVKQFTAGETIDTLKVAKQIFNFTSNKLDYILTYLGIENKITTNKQLWIDATRGCKIALDTMSTYCKGDVLRQRKVHYKLRPYMTNHPNMNHYSGEIPVCPNCASEHIQKRGFVSTRVSKKQRFQCMDCGAWSTGKSAIGPSTEVR